jgi:DNA topoisomerase-1
VSASPSQSPNQRERLSRTGYRRLGTIKRGFRYVRSDGRRVAGKELDRVKSLVLPPAWRQVAVSASPKAKLQAVGLDQAGRWQYRYHPAFVAHQEKAKYEKLIRFSYALPRMRRDVALHLGDRGLHRERVMACILRILSTCFIRAGSQVYADENGSYGIATLQTRHVRVAGDTVYFDYPGKSHQRQMRHVSDRRVAAVIRALLKVRGKKLFVYLEPDGRVVKVRRNEINAYIKQVMGEEFSAKDFRTWAGTLICASALARVGSEPGDSARVRKQKVVTAIKETAEQLGNTPAVCKSSYIYPSVLSAYEKGSVIHQYFHTVEELVQHRAPRLHGSERALQKLLRESRT